MDFSEPIIWRVVSFEKVVGTNDDGTPVMDSADTVTEYAEGYLPLLAADKSITLKAFDGVMEADAVPDAASSHSHTAGEYYGRYGGSNYWGDSNLRCWLNSSADGGEVNWTCGYPPVKSYMNPLDNNYDSEKGFLNSFSATERNAIVSVSQKTLIDARYDGTDIDQNTYEDAPLYGDVSNVPIIYDLYQYEYNTDTVFLPDLMQVYNMYQNSEYLGGDGFSTELTYAAREEIPENSDYYGKNMQEYPYWMRTPQDGTGEQMAYIAAYEIPESP